MPTILIYYLLAVSLSLAVGVTLYYTLGGSIVPLLSRLFGPTAGAMWGRAFRIGLVAVTLVGGLSTRWWDCGYSDYQAVAASHGRMWSKTTEQLGNALDYALFYVIVSAAVASLMFVLLKRANQS